MGLLTWLVQGSSALLAALCLSWRTVDRAQQSVALRQTAAPSGFCFVVSGKIKCVLQSEKLLHPEGGHSSILLQQKPSWESWRPHLSWSHCTTERRNHKSDSLGMEMFMAEADHQGAGDHRGVRRAGVRGPPGAFFHHRHPAVAPEWRKRQE